jgi:hypothetical protein
MGKGSTYCDVNLIAYTSVVGFFALEVALSKTWFKTWFKTTSLSLSLSLSLG